MVYYPPVRPQPPFVCVCGEHFTAWKYLERHLFHERRAATVKGEKTTHGKKRLVSHSEAAKKAKVTRRNRRLNFMNGE